MKVPRWLILQQEIDYHIYLLKRIAWDQAKRHPLEIMIDKSTGFDKAQEKEMLRISKKLKKLKKEWDNL